MENKKIILFNTKKGEGGGGTGKNDGAGKIPNGNDKGEVAHENDKGEIVVRPMHIGDFRLFRFASLGQWRQWLMQAKINTHNAARWQFILEYNKARIAEGDTWLGLPTPTSINEIETRYKFPRIDEFNELYRKLQKDLNAVQRKKTRVDVIRPRWRHSDQEIGEFDLDAAAQGFRWLHKADGTKRLVTDIRKVYIYKQKPPRRQKTIRIYVAQCINAQQSYEAMLYRGMLAVAIAKHAQKKGDKVEIYGYVFSEDYPRTFGTLICLKQKHQAINLHTLLLATADTATFRHLGFKSVIVSANYVKHNISSGLGRELDIWQNANIIRQTIKNNDTFIMIPDVKNYDDLIQNINHFIAQINA